MIKVDAIEFIIWGYAKLGSKIDRCHLELATPEELGEILDELHEDLDNL